jgi:hypothetical protein
MVEQARRAEVELEGAAARYTPPPSPLVRFGCLLFRSLARVRNQDSSSCPGPQALRAQPCFQRRQAANSQTINLKPYFLQSQQPVPPSHVSLIPDPLFTMMMMIQF